MIPAVRILCILTALAASAVSLAAATTPYLGFIAAVLFVLAAVLSGDPKTTRILLLATGEILVIASASASFPAGVAVQAAVIGAVFFEKTGLPEQGDALQFALWCLAVLAGSAVLYFSNQVLISFLAITAGTAGITALLVIVLEIRERRTYAGGAE
jgi:hypothetical protein